MRLRTGTCTAAVTAALLLAGCGSGSHATTHPPAPAGAPRTTVLPDPRATHIRASAAELSVIEGWSSALRHGNIDAAAQYFAFPSTFVNGAPVGNTVSGVVLRNLSQARVANEGLPCGATFVSADVRGRYVNALFRLGGRAGPGGSDCGGGTSATARVDFRIAGGKIVVWLRAPDDPGDNGSAPGRTPPSPTPTGPQNGTGTPVV